MHTIKQYPLSRGKTDTETMISANIFEPTQQESFVKRSPTCSLPILGCPFPHTHTELRQQPFQHFTHTCFQYFSLNLIHLFYYFYFQPPYCCISSFICPPGSSLIALNPIPPHPNHKIPCSILSLTLMKNILAISLIPLQPCSALLNFYHLLNTFFGSGHFFHT